MTEQKDSRRYLIPGLERGLTLLMELARNHREMSFAELAERMDFPKATAYRAVQTLEYMGFVRRHPTTGTYSLGVNVLRLGFEFVAGLDLVQAGMPVIESLRDETGCSSHIAIRDGQDVIYVARVSAANAAINHVSVGTRLPAHRTSLGRVLLSDLSRADFDRVYPSEELPDTKPGAPDSREALWELVQQDKARGYVIGESFFQFGISSVVYPVFNNRGSVEGVVSILVPVHEIPAHEREGFRENVRAAARNISGMLGYRGSPDAASQLMQTR